MYSKGQYFAPCPSKSTRSQGTVRVISSYLPSLLNNLSACSKRQWRLHQVDSHCCLFFKEDGQQKGKLSPRLQIEATRFSKLGTSGKRKVKESRCPSQVQESPEDQMLIGLDKEQKMVNSVYLHGLKHLIRKYNPPIEMFVAS